MRFSRGFSDERRRNCITRTCQKFILNLSISGTHLPVPKCISFYRSYRESQFIISVYTLLVLLMLMRISVKISETTLLYLGGLLFADTANAAASAKSLTGVCAPCE